MSSNPVISDRLVLVGAYLLPVYLLGAIQGLRAVFGSEFMAGVALMATFGWAVVYVGCRYWRLIRRMDTSDGNLRILEVTMCRPYRVNDHWGVLVAAMMVALFLGLFDEPLQVLMTTAVMLTAVGAAVAVGLLPPVLVPSRCVRAFVGDEEVCLIAASREPTGRIAAWRITDGVFKEADAGEEADQRGSPRTAPR